MQNINDYVFGDNSGRAGIGCITGDAGCEVQHLSRNEFVATVRDALDEEQFDTTELRAELTAEVDELYAQYIESLKLDNDSCTLCVAIDDLSGIVFGTGADEGACHADATEGTDNPEGLTYYDATEAAYVYAKLNGGDSKWDMFRIESGSRIYLA